MKKALAILASVAVIAGIVGCTPEQQAAVARQLGVASAVTWIGIDNPEQEDINTVKTVVGVIKAACTNTASNASYYASVYPIADQYITEKVPVNRQPMAKLGAAFVLTSLDTAFAMNPSWKKNSETAVMMVQAYCEGAETGLSMSSSDPVRLAATRQTVMRIGTLKLVK